MSSAACPFCHKLFKQKGINIHVCNCSARKSAMEAAAPAILAKRTIADVEDAEFPDPKEQALDPVDFEMDVDASIPAPAITGRPRRAHRLPPQYKDMLPSAPTPVTFLQPPVIDVETPVAPPEDPVPQAPVFRTKPNALGMYKIYAALPTRDPDGDISIDDVCDSPAFAVPPAPEPAEQIPPVATEALPPPAPSRLPFAPFLSTTVARLMCWFHTGSNQKSVDELQRLADDVINQPDFNATDLAGFRATRENHRLDEGFDGDKDAADQATRPPAVSDRWETHTVRIRVPADKVSFRSEEHAPEFEVPGVVIRPLLSVLREAFEGPEFLKMHLTPYQHFWDKDHDPLADVKSPDSVEETPIQTDFVPASHEESNRPFS
ncbi:hypothetical protein C8J56DRAFT_277532 [Mycena floridula]|nr:hypothetical protein C8J56DRAFT_277532 [Mycena floridula]